MHNSSILILGCGSIGKRHARILHRLGITDLRACDPVESQLGALAAETPVTKTYAAYDDALNDQPDAVLIGTQPPGLARCFRGRFRRRRGVQCAPPHPGAGHAGTASRRRRHGEDGRA